MNTDSIALLIILAGLLAFVAMHPPSLPPGGGQADATPAPAARQRQHTPRQPKRQPDPLARLTFYLPPDPLARLAPYLGA